MNELKIVDDFLPLIQQRELEQLTVYNKKLSWTYSQDFENYDERHSIKHRKNDPEIYKPPYGQLFHNLIAYDTVTSVIYDQLPDFRTKIETKFGVPVGAIHRMRVNLVLPNVINTDQYTTPHYDYSDGKILIYYITESDGDTVLFNEQYQGQDNFDKKTILDRVSPKRGRAIMFDAYRYHAGCMPKNSVRAIINMVFFTQHPKFSLFSSVVAAPS